MAGFIDIEATLIAYLNATVSYAKYGVRTPQDLLSKLPFGQIRKIDGSDDNITDTSIVDIDTFTATDPTSPNYAQAQTFARDVRDAMRNLQHLEVGAVVVDSTDILSSPVNIPYDDEHVNRLVASYMVSSRIQ